MFTAEVETINIAKMYLNERYLNVIDRGGLET